MRLRKLLAKVLDLHTAGALAGIKQILIQTQHRLLCFSTGEIERHSTITCHKFSTVHAAKIPKVVQGVKVGHKTKRLHLQRRSSNRGRRNKNLVALDLQCNQHPTVAGINTLALVSFVYHNQSVGFELEFRHFTLGILVERLHRVLQLLPLHVFGIATPKLFIVDNSNSLKLEACQNLFPLMNNTLGTDNSERTIQLANNRSSGICLASASFTHIHGVAVHIK